MRWLPDCRVCIFIFMLSQSAKDGFDMLLTQSLKSSLVPAGMSADVFTLSDTATIAEDKMVVLTVSSYLFRLMVMFYFSPNAATRDHFARLNNVSEGELSEQGFMDAIAESGNLCCGVLNRDLGNFFPHIGMSTPNVIDKNCAAYLQSLNCDHIQHFAVDIDGSPRFHATLCVSAYADIDFTVVADELGSDTGELELF